MVARGTGDCVFALQLNVEKGPLLSCVKLDILGTNKLRERRIGRCIEREELLFL
jgi:hypothetical protein